MSRLTPINMAEAIFEPFWDPQLSGLAEWRVARGAAHGLRVFQNWCFVQFEWARRPVDGPALSMTRDFDLPCHDYDHLMISVMAPAGSRFRLDAQTDLGVLHFEAPPAPSLKKEYAIPLEGATVIRQITLVVKAAADGVAVGWFNWIGLQNAALLPRHLEQWDRFDSRWEGYLQPETFEPGFQPTYGILINANELTACRAEHNAFLSQHGQSPFTLAAERASRLIPEQMIHDFVNFWTDTRYCRERDHSHLLLTHGPAAAVAGLLLQDKALLRLAARYALAIASCAHWDDGFICDFPGGNFEHRCFVQSLCVHETALILDLAGEMFTDMGREHLRRRIAEEGLGSIHFNTWRHEYIFHCNQLAWFTPGRMLGCLVMERAMPRVRPFTELAYSDLVESLGYTVLPDGGYVEGPTYFRCVSRDGGLSLYYYARGRDLSFRSVVPEVMLRTAAFGAAVASTDEASDVIPICDARPIMELEGVAVMAALLPESAWVGMYRKALERGGFSHAAPGERGVGGMPDTLLGWQLGRQVPDQAQPLPAFTFLPEMGIMASVRTLHGELVKLLLMGNRAGAGHTHEDKGSFVLEFAGDTFALDPGTCDYANPLSLELKQCERHNMLIPTGVTERPHPESPLPVDVKPQGQGDAISFTAAIDAVPGWEKYYRRWRRTWESPTPDVLLVSDDYELLTGDGVDFFWQTRLPIEITCTGETPARAVITGRRGEITIEAPADCTVRLDALPLLDEAIQRRLVIHKAARQGRLEVRIALRIRSF